MVVNGGSRVPTDMGCAKRWAKPDQAGPRGSQNHATARDIEQFPQMLDRIGSAAYLVTSDAFLVVTSCQFQVSQRRCSLSPISARLVIALECFVLI